VPACRRWNLGRQTKAPTALPGELPLQSKAHQLRSEVLCNAPGEGAFVFSWRQIFSTVLRDSRTLISVLCSANLVAVVFKRIQMRSIAVNGRLAFLSRKCGLAGPAELTVKAY
jgi:hypothetical protein